MSFEFNKKTKKLSNMIQNSVLELFANKFPKKSNKNFFEIKNKKNDKNVIICHDNS